MNKPEPGELIVDDVTGDISIEDHDGNLVSAIKDIKMKLQESKIHLNDVKSQIDTLVTNSKTDVDGYMNLRKQTAISKFDAVQIKPSGNANTDLANIRSILGKSGPASNDKPGNVIYFNPGTYYLETTNEHADIIYTGNNLIINAEDAKFITTKKNSNLINATTINVGDNVIWNGGDFTGSRPRFTTGNKNVFANMIMKVGKFGTFHNNINSTSSDVVIRNCFFYNDSVFTSGRTYRSTMFIDYGNISNLTIENNIFRADNIKGSEGTFAPDIFAEHPNSSQPRGYSRSKDDDNPNKDAGHMSQNININDNVIINPKWSTNTTNNAKGGEAIGVQGAPITILGSTEGVEINHNKFYDTWLNPDATYWNGGNPPEGKIRYHEKIDIIVGDHEQSAHSININDNKVIMIWSELINANFKAGSFVTGITRKVGLTSDYLNDTNDKPTTPNWNKYQIYESSEKRPSHNLEDNIYFVNIGENHFQLKAINKDATVDKSNTFKPFKKVVAGVSDTDMKYNIKLSTSNAIFDTITADDKITIHDIITYGKQLPKKTFIYGGIGFALDNLSDQLDKLEHLAENETDAMLQDQRILQALYTQIKENQMMLALVLSQNPDTYRKIDEMNYILLETLKMWKLAVDDYNVMIGEYKNLINTVKTKATKYELRQTLNVDIANHNRYVNNHKGNINRKNYMDYLILDSFNNNLPWPMGLKYKTSDNNLNGTDYWTKSRPKKTFNPK